MRYLSVKDFFNQLQSRGNILIFLPAGIFALYFLLLGIEEIAVRTRAEEYEHHAFWSLLCIVLICLLITHLLVMSKIKKIPADVGLGRRLEKLGDIYHFRLYITTLIATPITLSLFICRDNYLGLIFVIIFIFHFITSPGPRQVVRHLKLSGEERKIIEKKGNDFDF